MSSLHGIRKTQLFADYLRKSLAAAFSQDGKEVEIPDCSLDFLEELDYSLKVVKEAIRNKSELLYVLQQY